MLANAFILTYFTCVLVSITNSITVNAHKSYQGFTLQPDRRCIGGKRIGEPHEDTVKCVSLCEAREDCAGFNFRLSDGVCIVRTKSCVTQIDPTTVYYKRTEPTVQVKTIQSSPDAAVSYDGFEISGYQLESGWKCYGDGFSKIGQTGSDLTHCISLCDVVSSCFGINWFRETKRCVARTDHCLLMQDPDASFYRKLPATEPPPTEKTESFGPSEKESAVTNFSGYEMEAERRCVGDSYSKIGSSLTDLVQCVILCDSSSECFGVNWRKDINLCIVRTAACYMEDDMSSDFYKKLPPVQEEPSSEEVSSEKQKNEDLETSEPFDPKRIFSFSGYKTEEGRRCSGDSWSKIGSTLHDLMECVILCDSNSECFGINWRHELSICIVRTRDCVMEEDDTSAFYRKEVPKQETTTTTPPTTTTSSTTSSTTRTSTTARTKTTPSTTTTSPSPTTSTSSATTSTTSTSTTARPTTTSSTTTTTSIPSSTTTTPETTTHARDFPNYVAMKGRRCSGGKSGKIGDASEDMHECAALCDLRSDCIGFNWQRRANLCVAKTFGCIETSDTPTTFFMKIQRPAPSAVGVDGKTTIWLKTDSATTGSSTSTTSQTTLSTTKSTSPTPTPEMTTPQEMTSSTSITTPKPATPIPITTEVTVVPDVFEGLDTITWVTSILFKNYVVAAGRACAADPATQIGDAQPDTLRCASLCDGRQDCFGFTLYPKRRICLVRSMSCKMEVDEEDGAILYRRKYMRSTTSKPTKSTKPFQPVARFVVEDPLFRVKAKIRCSDGVSRRLQTASYAHVSCAAACLVDPDCIGYNLQMPEGNCEMQSAGCIEEENPSYVFFAKKTAPTPEPTTAIIPVLSYTVFKDVRCLGGISASLGMQRNLEQCRHVCWRNPTCHGFNVIEATGDCTLRTGGCFEYKSPGMTWHKKEQ